MPCPSKRKTAVKKSKAAAGAKKPRKNTQRATQRYAKGKSRSK